jgi:hypothetical protein
MNNSSTQIRFPSICIILSFLVNAFGLYAQTVSGHEFVEAD